MLTIIHQKSRRTAPRMRAPLLRVLFACALAAGAAGALAQTAVDPAAPATAKSLQTVIVTAQRKAQSVARVPLSITVFTAQNLQDFNIQSFDDYATKTPNLSFTYGSGATGIADARTVSIRGITGQNLGATSGATGFYIDDTPVPASIDPRVLDVSNIEVLKGPQGTLFGEGSLGGNVRLITNQPDLTQDGGSYMAQTGITSGGGSPDGGGDLIDNVVLSQDRLALRTVLFFNHDAGYLTRTYPTDPSSPGTGDPFLNVPRSSVNDQGADTSFGGSVTGLLKVTDYFDATLRFMLQRTGDNGFQAAPAPLPAFTPDYIIDRAFNVQPHANDSWSLPSLELRYHQGLWQVSSSTAYFYRDTQDVEDSTYGTQQIMQGFYGVCCLAAQPYLWKGEHYTNQVTEELRASFSPVDNFSGTFGVFYSTARSLFSIPPISATGLVAATADNTVVGPWPNDTLWFSDGYEKQRDTSIYGQFYYTFRKLTLTVGARQYWLTQRANGDAGGFQDFSPLNVTPPTSNSESGTDPKVVLSYQATGNTMVYASASEGFRAGDTSGPVSLICSEPGLTASDIENLKADTVWSYEAGAKVQVPDPGLLVSVDGFHIDWDNPQQEVGLPCGDYFQINGKKATIDGAELDISGHLAPGLTVRVGAGYEKTDLTQPGALLYGGVLPGSRLPGVPAFNATVGGVYTLELTDSLDGFVSADYSYTGDAVAPVVSGGGAEATRAGYSLANLRLGVDAGKSEISLNVHNLTNARPNLGDIGYVGYAQFDSIGRVIPNVATLPTTTVELQYRRTF
jgi:iron complex outermembrane receptor protein